MIGFPTFHLGVVASGAIAGYLIGCYEANALTRYDALLQKYQERRADWKPVAAGIFTYMAVRLRTGLFHFCPYSVVYFPTARTLCY